MHESKEKKYETLLEDVLKKAKAPREIYKEYERVGRLKEKIKVADKKEAERLAETISCLSNPKRLLLLSMLTSPHCTCILSKLLGEDQSLIAHHLSKLKTCGLVIERRISRSRMYVRNEEALRTLLVKLINFLELALDEKHDFDTAG